MDDGLLGKVKQTSLLGDVRAENLRRMRELGKRIEKNELTLEESKQLRKNHPSDSYFQAYANFNAINDPIFTPLINMIMNQPDKSMSDIFDYRGSPDDINNVERWGFLRGLYNLKNDKISLIADPVAKDIGVPIDSRGAFYSSMPFMTKIGDDNTAAHEIVHAGFNRDITGNRYNANSQHEVINYQLAKSLIDNEDYWVNKYGEDEYKKELVNSIARYLYNYNDNEAPKLAENIDSISTSDLKEKLQYIIRTGARSWTSKVLTTPMYNGSPDMDFEKIKNITGKPESQNLRERKRSK